MSDTLDIKHEKDNREIIEEIISKIFPANLKEISLSLKDVLRDGYGVKYDPFHYDTGNPIISLFKEFLTNQLEIFLKNYAVIPLQDDESLIKLFEKWKGDEGFYFYIAKELGFYRKKETKAEKFHRLTGHELTPAVLEALDWNDDQ